MIDEAIDILIKQTQIFTTEKDWSYESVTLEKEEIDAETIPKNLSLPSLVVAHLYLCNVSREKEYLVYFLTDTQSKYEYVQGLLFNDKLVWYDIKEQQI